MSQGKPSVLLLVLTLLFSSSPFAAQEALRVATWNTQSLGNQGSNEWNRTVDIINRIGADVVALQEIDTAAEAALIPTLAGATGYSDWAVSSISGTLSGDFRGAVLSNYPILFSASHSAAQLSGDPNANDITRDIFEVHVQVPNAAERTAIFVLHLKAGSFNENKFRRAIEIHRLSQAISAYQSQYPMGSWLVVGDLNEDLGDGPFGQTFNAVPGGLPQTYSLGSDINFPVVYDPFNSLLAMGALIADATQEDSTTLYATRPSSGRRLDYVIYANGALLGGDEVYNSVRDNGIDDTPIGNWLPKVGAPLPATASAQSSDHFAVFADLTVPSATVNTALYPGSGEDFVMSTGVNGLPTSGPGNEIKTASAGDFFYVHYASPGGTFDGEPPVIIVEPFPFPGIPPFGPLPGMWFSLQGTAVVLFNGLEQPGGFQAVIAPILGNTHSYLVPPGFAGVSMLVQSLAISSLASNGFLAFSDAHQLDLVP